MKSVHRTFQRLQARSNNLSVRTTLKIVTQIQIFTGQWSETLFPTSAKIGSYRSNSKEIFLSGVACAAPGVTPSSSKCVTVTSFGNASPAAFNARYAKPALVMCDLVTRAARAFDAKPWSNCCTRPLVRQ